MDKKGIAMAMKAGLLVGVLLSLFVYFKSAKGTALHTKTWSANPLKQQFLLSQERREDVPRLIYLPSNRALKASFRLPRSKHIDITWSTTAEHFVSNLLVDEGYACLDGKYLIKEKCKRVAMSPDGKVIVSMDYTPAIDMFIREEKQGLNHTTCSLRECQDINPGFSTPFFAYSHRLLYFESATAGVVNAVISLELGATPKIKEFWHNPIDEEKGDSKEILVHAKQPRCVIIPSYLENQFFAYNASQSKVTLYSANDLKQPIVEWNISDIDKQRLFVHSLTFTLIQNLLIIVGVDSHSKMVVYKFQDPKKESTIRLSEKNRAFEHKVPQGLCIGKIRIKAINQNIVYFNLPQHIVCWNIESNSVTIIKLDQSMGEQDSMTLVDPHTIVCKWQGVHHVYLLKHD